MLVANGARSLAVRTAVEAASLFGITENSVRVGLARLSADGLVAARERGEYVLAEAAQGLAREVAHWREAETRVCRWNGAYVAVFTATLGRTHRTALRRRMRALSILGFGEFDRGLHVRPDNLRGGVAGVAKRLAALGLEPGAPVFAAARFTDAGQDRIRALWDGEGLTAAYVRTRKRLEAWLDTAHRLGPDQAARESFLLGGAAIRQIVFDPLLPPPFVDVAERGAFIETMKIMDRAGRRIWMNRFDLEKLPSPSRLLGGSIGHGSIDQAH